MGNKFITYETNTFTNDNGDKISYTLKYSAAKSYDNIPYLTTFDVVGCETSNPKMYNDICGNTRIIKSSIKKSPKQTVAFFDKSKTYGSLLGIIAAAGVLTTILVVTLKKQVATIKMELSDFLLPICHPISGW